MSLTYSKDQTLSPSSISRFLITPVFYFPRGQAFSSLSSSVHHCSRTQLAGHENESMWLLLGSLFIVILIVVAFFFHQVLLIVCLFILYFLSEASNKGAVKEFKV